MIPLRLDVDTNIVVSAALKPDGLQRTVLLLAITKPARLYTSTAILAEYRDVLSRPELQIRNGQCGLTMKARRSSPARGCGRIDSGVLISNQADLSHRLSSHA